MRTNIVIDDKLMLDALQASGYTSKSQAIEDGLKLLVKLHTQRNIRQLRGKLRWEGNLDTLRGAGDTH